MLLSRQEVERRRVPCANDVGVDYSADPYTVDDIRDASDEEKNSPDLYLRYKIEIVSIAITTHLCSQEEIDVIPTSDPVLWRRINDDDWASVIRMAISNRRPWWMDFENVHHLAAAGFRYSTTSRRWFYPIEGSSPLAPTKERRRRIRAQAPSTHQFNALTSENRRLEKEVAVLKALIEETQAMRIDTPPVSPPANRRVEDE